MAKSGLLDHLSKKGDQGSNDIIDHGEIKLTNNLFYCQGKIYQLSNVTRAYVYPCAKNPLPLKKILIAAIIGLLTLPAFGIGLIGLILAGYWIYKYIKEKETDWFGLFFEMNSGYRFRISSKDQYFLMRVLISLTDAIADRLTGTQIINIESRQIYASNIEGVVNLGDMSDVQQGVYK
ncbi:MAG: hypothetical protein FWF05_04790 [Oscillospiraceae bacterium]|nr:hypothetical protein [Oscillospiraceae bacterium]